MTTVQKCVAIYNFEARSKKELSFKVGDEIIVQTKLTGGWWIGELNGEVGLFPVNYVDVKEEVENPWYAKIKLKVAPSSLIEKLQKECGLLSEKKEMTKLERQKISDTITDLQNKMEETINKNLAIQSKSLSSPTIATAPKDPTQDGDKSHIKHMGRDRPLGPRGRREMSRGHLSTMKLRNLTSSEDAADGEQMSDENVSSNSKNEEGEQVVVIQEVKNNDNEITKPIVSRHKRTPSSDSASKLNSDDKSMKLEKNLMRATSTRFVKIEEEEEEENDRKKKSSKKEIRELTRKLRAETKVRQQLEEEIEKIKENAGIQKENDSTLLNKLESKSKKIQSLKKEIEKNNILIAQLQNDLQSKVKNESNVKEQLTNTLTQEANIRQLTYELDQWKVKEELAREREIVANSKNKDMKDKMNKLLSDLRDKERLIATKTNEISAITDMKDKLTVMNRQLTLDLAKANESLKLQDTSSHFHQQSIEMLANKLTSMEATIESMKSHETQLEAFKCTLEERNSNLETLLKSKDEEINAIRENSRNDFKTLEKNYSEAKSAKDQAISEKYDLEIKYQSEIEELRKEIKEKEEKVNELKELNQKNIDLIENRNQEIRKLEIEKHDAKQKIDILEDRLNQLEKTNEDITLQFNSKISELEANLKLENSLKQSLQDTVQQLELKISGEERQIASMNSDSEKFEFLTLQLSESLSQLQNLRDKLEEERAKSATLIVQHQTNLQQKQTQFDQQINDLREVHLKDLNKVNFESKKNLEMKDHEIQSKLNTIDELRAINRISQVNIAELTEKIRKSEEELSTSNQQIKRLETTLSDEKDSHSKLLSSKSEEIENLKSYDQQIIKNLQDQLSQSKSSLDHLRLQSQNEIRTITEQFQSKIEKLEQSLIQKSSTDENELGTQLDQSNRIASLEHEIRVLKDQNETFESKEKEEKSQLTLQFQSEISELQKEINRINSTNLENIEKLKLEYDQRVSELTSNWEKRGQFPSSADSSSFPILTLENEKLKKKMEDYKKKLKEVEKYYQNEVQKLSTELAKRSIIPENDKKSNLKAFDEIVELRSELAHLESELQEKELKYTKLKSEMDLSKRSQLNQIEELNIELSKAKEKILKLELESENSKDTLEAERKLRDQLQDSVREFEKRVDQLQTETMQYRDAEAKARAHRLQELTSIPENKRTMKALVEEKHLLEAKVKSLERDLVDQKKLFTELETAFASKLESLIATIDSEYERRDRLEIENKSLATRLDEVQDLLVEETKIRRHIELSLVEQAQKTVELELELLDETKTQTRLKEEVAAKLDGFCNTLDTMYDKQMQLQEEKHDLEAIVEELEQKLVDEAKLRIELNEKLAIEAELRSQLESNFIDKLEKLSLLIMSEKEGSTYEDLDAP